MNTIIGEGDRKNTKTIHQTDLKENSSKEHLLDIQNNEEDVKVLSPIKQFEPDQMNPPETILEKDGNKEQNERPSLIYQNMDADYQKISEKETNEMTDQYLEQARILIEMLKASPKTLIQANQLSIYVKNHSSFAKSESIELVIQGYEKLATYIQSLIKTLSKQEDLIWAE